MQVKSEFSCNTVILISSPRTGEEGVSRRIAEDLDVLARSASEFEFRHVSVDSCAHLVNIFLELEYLAKQGVKPIIHIDMHGSLEHGLQIGASQEMFSWEMLVENFRPINIACEGNLLVILSACFGIRAIKPVSIHHSTPFFALIAPEKEITIGEIEQAILCFYTKLMRDRSLDAAYDALTGNFRYFHAEKMLVISLAKYINSACKGKGARERREKLLSEIFQNSAIENNKHNRRRLRRQIKDHIKPDQALLDVYATRFLLGKKCSIKIGDIMKEIE